MRGFRLGKNSGSGTFRFLDVPLHQWNQDVLAFHNDAHFLRAVFGQYRVLLEQPACVAVAADRIVCRCQRG
ncbi:hypothetical protein D9M70_647080 [compost metagenome]